MGTHIHACSHMRIQSIHMLTHAFIYSNIHTYMLTYTQMHIQIHVHIYTHVTCHVHRGTHTYILFTHIHRLTDNICTHTTVVSRTLTGALTNSDLHSHSILYSYTHRCTHIPYIHTGTHILRIYICIYIEPHIYPHTLTRPHTHPIIHSQMHAHDRYTQ